MPRNTLSLIALLALLSACASPDNPSDPVSVNQEGTQPSDPEGLPPEFTGPPPAEPAEIFPEDPLDRKRRTDLLESIGDRWAAAMLEQRYAAMESIEAGVRTYSREHFEALMSDLQTGDMRNQRIAAWALGFSGSARARDPLLAATNSPFPDVAAHSLLGLSYLVRPMKGGSPARITTAEDLPGGKVYESDEVDLDPKVLLPFLQHAVASVRSNAALAILHSIHPSDPTPVSDEVVLALVAAKDDPDAATRSQVVGALGRTGRATALPHIVRSLQDDQVPLVRIRAAMALARLGELSAVPALIDALARPNQNEQVAKYVAGALSKLLDEEGLRSTRAEDWTPIARAKGLL